MLGVGLYVGNKFFGDLLRKLSFCRGLGFKFLGLMVIGYSILLIKYNWSYLIL